MDPLVSPFFFFFLHWVVGLPVSHTCAHVRNGK
jgi:hypothetical protein